MDRVRIFVWGAWLKNMLAFLLCCTVWVLGKHSGILLDIFLNPLPALSWNTPYLALERFHTLKSTDARAQAVLMICWLMKGGIVCQERCSLRKSAWGSCDPQSETGQWHWSAFTADLFKKKQKTKNQCLVINIWKQIHALRFCCVVVRMGKITVSRRTFFWFMFLHGWGVFHCEVKITF